MYCLQLNICCDLTYQITLNMKIPFCQIITLGFCLYYDSWCETWYSWLRSSKLFELWEAVIAVVCTCFSSSNCTLCCFKSHLTLLPTNHYYTKYYQRRFISSLVLYSPLSINQDNKDIVWTYNYLNISIDINIYMILATFQLISLHSLSDTYSRLTIIISGDWLQDHPGYRKTWTIQRLSRNIENKNL